MANSKLERSELNPLKQSVRQSLESPNYKSRTEEGMAQELGISPEIVKQTILSIEDIANSS